MPLKESTGGQIYIDRGEYTAEFLSLEDKPGGKYGDQLVWHFRLTDAEGYVLQNDRGDELDWWYWTGQSYQDTRAKAYPVVMALTGKDPASLSADEVALEIEGKSCLVFFADEPDPNSPGDVRSAAKSFSPIKPKAARPAAARGRAPAAAPADPGAGAGPIDQIPF